jgi:hypothetical protein
LNDGLTGADLNESTLDSNVVQKRINGTCAAWESIRSVSSTGSVFCSHGPAAFSAHDDYTGIICNDFCTEGTLSVPAGIYAVSAQIQGDNSLAAGADFFVQCRLSAGDDVNYARFYSHNNSLAATTLPMQLVHWFTSAGKVAVDCEDLGFGDVSGGALRITAISLGSVSNVQSNSG